MAQSVPAWRDPWKVAGGLVVLVGVLALLFPKPEQIEDAESNLPDPRTAPPGSQEGVFSEPAEVGCLKHGAPAARDDCRLMGAEGGMAYHLFVRWDFTELRQQQGRLVVTGARVELRENHEDQYEGPISIAAVPAAGDLAAALSGPALATGARISTRTLRAPLEASAPDLDALVSGWLRAEVPNHGILIRVDPDDDSSVDEFTPSLTFFYTEESND